jgi:hypothetical protein
MKVGLPTICSLAIINNHQRLFPFIGLPEFCSILGYGGYRQLNGVLLLTCLLDDAQTGIQLCHQPNLYGSLAEVYLWMLPQRFFASELHNDIVDAKGHPHLLHLRLATLPAANYPTPECLGAILLCVNLIYNPPSGTDETSE